MKHLIAEWLSQSFFPDGLQPSLVAVAKPPGLLRLMADLVAERRERSSQEVAAKCSPKGRFSPRGVATPPFGGDGGYGVSIYASRAARVQPQARRANAVASGGSRRRAALGKEAAVQSSDCSVPCHQGSLPLNEGTALQSKPRRTSTRQGGRVADTFSPGGKSWHPGPGEEVCIEPQLLANLLSPPSKTQPVSPGFSSSLFGGGGREAAGKGGAAATAMPPRSTAFPFVELLPPSWLHSLFSLGKAKAGEKTAPFPLKAGMATDRRRWMQAGKGAG